MRKNPKTLCEIFMDSPNPKPMSTPIAGTDSTLFEVYLQDKITSGRNVCIEVVSSHCTASVYGSLTELSEGVYLVRSTDGMSRCSFKLTDIHHMGDLCIFLKY